MIKKRFLKLTGLFLCLFLSTQSCRNEDSAIEYENTFQNNYSIIVLDKQQFESKTVLSQEIDKVKSNFFKPANTSGKIIIPQDPILEGAIIEDDRVLEITNGTEKTYTFPVSRVFSNDKIENLVLRQNADNTYSMVLIQYSLTKAEKEQYVQGLPVNLTGKIKTFKINNTSVVGKYTYSYYEGCWEYIYEVTPCGGTEHHGYGASCPLEGTSSQAQPTALIAAYNHCDDGGGSPSGGGSSSSGGGSGSGSTGSGTIGGGSGGGGSTSDPNASPYNTFIFISFDDMFDMCPTDDAQCQANMQFNMQVQQYLFSLNHRVSGLASYNPILFMIKDYFQAHGFGNEGTLTDRLTLVANWFNAQNNTDPNVKLKNFQFANFALTYLLTVNPSSYDYFVSHPTDLNKIKFKNLDYSNSQEVAGAYKMAEGFTEFLIAGENNTVNQMNFTINPVWTAIKDYMVYLIKTNVPKGVQYARYLYDFSADYLTTHPNALSAVNEFVEFLKVGVVGETSIITDPHYMKWTDVILSWLFEVGDFPINDSAGYGDLPTIGFAGSDYTISGNPSSILPMRYLAGHKVDNGVVAPTSVSGLRSRAINQIKNTGSTTPLDDEWVFGSDATIDTIVKLDGMQFCIGSYHTNVYITPLGNNQYKLTFVIKNKTGWQSGTRGLNDYNGDPTDDSVIPDKPRGAGVHLGGTIAQTYGWNEIITVN